MKRLCTNRSVVFFNKIVVLGCVYLLFSSLCNMMGCLPPDVCGLTLLDATEKQFAWIARFWKLQTANRTLYYAVGWETASTDIGEWKHVCYGQAGGVEYLNELLFCLVGPYPALSTHWNLQVPEDVQWDCCHFLEIKHCKVERGEEEEEERKETKRG